MSDRLRDVMTVLVTDCGTLQTRQTTVCLHVEDGLRDDPLAADCGTLALHVCMSMLRRSNMCNEVRNVFFNDVRLQHKESVTN